VYGPARGLLVSLRAGQPAGRRQQDKLGAARGEVPAGPPSLVNAREVEVRPLEADSRAARPGREGLRGVVQSAASDVSPRSLAGRAGSGAWAPILISASRGRTRCLLCWRCLSRMYIVHRSPR
jgi:hypothetical protein